MLTNRSARGDTAEYGRSVAPRPLAGWLDAKRNGATRADTPLIRLKIRWGKFRVGTSPTFGIRLRKARNADAETTAWTRSVTRVGAKVVLDLNAPARAARASGRPCSARESSQAAKQERRWMSDE